MSESERIKEELAQAKDRYERALRKSQDLGDKHVSVELDNELGQLRLSAYGQLDSIQLNEGQLNFTNGRSLGTAIVRALEQGEEKARRLREG